MPKNFSALVVESSESVRSHLVSILKTQLEFGQVHEASDAHSAIEILRSGQKIDWIFSDWEMPGLPGEEFLNHVKRTPSASMAPFIMLTTCGESVNLMNAAQAGVTDCLLKPLNVSILIDKIRKIAAEGERRRKGRFKILSGSKVTVQLSQSNSIVASLVDISFSGCLLILSAPIRETKGIYDVISISLAEKEMPLELKGRFVRLENYKQDPDVNKYIYAAFEFVDLDDATVQKLRKLSEKYIPATRAS